MPHGGKVGLGNTARIQMQMDNDAIARHGSGGRQVDAGAEQGAQRSVKRPHAFLTGSQHTGRSWNHRKVPAGAAGLCKLDA